MHGQVTCPWELDSIAVRVEDAGAGLRFSSGALSYRKTPTILSKRALAETSRARHGRRAQRHTPDALSLHPPHFPLPRGTASLRERLRLSA